MRKLCQIGSSPALIHVSRSHHACLRVVREDIRGFHVRVKIRCDRSYIRRSWSLLSIGLETTGATRARFLAAAYAASPAGAMPVARRGRPPGFEEGHRRCHEDIQSGLPQMLDLICPGERVYSSLRCKQLRNSGKQLRGLLVNLSRSMRNANSRMESIRHDHLSLSAEQMSMSCKAFTVAPPRVQTTSFVGSCFSSAPSKMPGPPASRPSCPTFATRGRIAVPSRTIRSLPDM